MSIKNYIAIARPDHWFKNVFVLPGIAFAAMLNQVPISEIYVKIIIGLVSVCFIASANYVINEWLDAEFDQFHPVKKNRPSVVGNLKPVLVYTEYAAFIAAGLLLSYLVSPYFLAANTFLLVMGFLYNVKPFRTKDKVYMDVLSESVNNAIRLMLGWFIVTSFPLPPASLVLGYWMGGAFLMAVKRYSEFRFINNNEDAGLYRRSFKYYTEETLLISAFFYALTAIFFLGVFLVKYRVELVLSVPFFATLFAWYLHIGMKKESAAQNPEHMYREKKFLLFTILLVVVVAALLFIDIPELTWLLDNAFIVQARP
ncbi:UbiA prenyltransferase family protein [Candidatus Contubernalis alkaliaceticus]|uniref:UbiA prenyltransferase family protein n=1 Tax=Candidatus Contubernalis alkaliaceticus TaxID=338645 RepID=UPI001F4C48E6|nr:UbiA prenyltransferase family protein [Candidatus Contubernalis alkalaceticus]UNC93646.1 UbiA prenyltransferase family protein [Candidatus Contubernalis alkalaceticus]